MQFDTDLVALRQQSAPFYLRWQFWWTAVPIMLTLMLAATAIALRVTSPNAVGLHSAVLKVGKFTQANRQLLVAAKPILADLGALLVFSAYHVLVTHSTV